MPKGVLFSLQKKLLRYLRRDFYFFPQEYKVALVLKLANLSNKTKKFLVVFPLPPNAQSQKVRGLKFNLKGEPGKEEVYENRFFVTQLTLGSREKRVVKETFLAKVWPVFYKKPLPCLKKEKAAANRFIFSNRRIEELKDKIVEDKSSSSSAVFPIYSYIKDSLTYGDPIEGLYTAYEALNKDRVDCGGFVSLFCSLLGSIDVACYPVFGFLAGYKKNSLHAWAEAIDSQGQSVPFDPSSDNLWKKGRSFKSGGFGWVGSDRITLSRGCDFKIKLDDKLIRVDILQYPIVIPKDKEIKVAVLFKTKRI